MYKLDKEKSIVMKRVNENFPKTLWWGKTFAVVFPTGTLLSLCVHSMNLSDKYNHLFKGENPLAAVFIPVIAATLTVTIINLRKEWKRWVMLGEKIKEQDELILQQETEQLGQFITSEQQIKKEFVRGDKVVNFDFFNPDATGGRVEELGGRQKIINLPQ